MKWPRTSTDDLRVGNYGYNSDDLRVMTKKLESWFSSYYVIFK